MEKVFKAIWFKLHGKHICEHHECLEEGLPRDIYLSDDKIYLCGQHKNDLRCLYLTW